MNHNIVVRQIFSDDPLLLEFMERCSSKGLENNSSLKAIKFDHFEHSAFFAAIQNNKIKAFSGIHNFEYDDKKFYRVGFRTASLYDDDFRFPLLKNTFKSSIQHGLLYPVQIMYAKKHYPNAPFIITTNTSANLNSSGKSHIVDRACRKGHIQGVSLLYENIFYLNTYQNVWLLDEDLFLDVFQRKYFDVDINFIENYLYD